MEIKNIVVSFTTKLSPHMGNNGDKFMNNENTLKSTSDGRVYLSPQTVRHSMFQNFIENYKFDTDEIHSVSEASSISENDKSSISILNDTRLDIGGDMVPKVFKRKSVVSVTPAIAMEKSSIMQDFLVRYDKQPNGNGNNNIVNNNISEKDEMEFNFSIEVDEILKERVYESDGKNFIIEKINDHNKDDRRKKRVIALLESLRDFYPYFANQSRFGIDTSPEKCFISINTNSKVKKGFNYFSKSDIAKKNIVTDLKHRGSYVILGDDDSEYSSYSAFNEAINIVKSSNI